MAKRSKLASSTKVSTPKAKAAARRRLAARKTPLRSKLKVGASAEKSASAKSTANKKDGSALAALSALLTSLPGLALGAAAPAMRKTEQALGNIDIASFIGALTAAMPEGNGKKSAKRQLTEEAALLAAAIGLIALRRKLPLAKIIGSGVPGNVLGLLSALRALKK